MHPDDFEDAEEEDGEGEAGPNSQQGQRDFVHVGRPGLVEQQQPLEGGDEQPSPPLRGQQDQEEEEEQAPEGGVSLLKADATRPQRPADGLVQIGLGLPLPRGCLLRNRVCPVCVARLTEQRRSATTWPLRCVRVTTSQQAVGVWSRSGSRRPVGDS